jgi:Ser-tRNA(Ala) deacylase AlaX
MITISINGKTYKTNVEENAYFDALMKYFLSHWNKFLEEVKENKNISDYEYYQKDWEILKENKELDLEFTPWDQSQVKIGSIDHMW